MEKVNWHRLIRAAFVVPKHAFISWMAILNRLSTKERIKSWGLEIEETCVLCRNVVETGEHLFFGCDFSRGLWKEVLMLCEEPQKVNN